MQRQVEKGNRKRSRFIRNELITHIVRLSTGHSFFHIVIAVLVSTHVIMLLLFCPLYILAFDPSSPSQQGFSTVTSRIQGLGIAYSFGTGSLIIFLSAILTTLAMLFSHLMVGEENLVYIFGMIFGMVALPVVGIRSGQALRERIELQFTANNLISELEQQKTALQIARQEANAAKSNFLAHASHDLRQPLHAIGLFLESLPEEMEDQQTAYTIARVKQSQRQPSELFDTLLDVSVIDIGEVDVELGDIALGDLLSQIVQEFRPAAAEAGVNLRFVPTRHWVRADPQLLDRMIRNLVSTGENSMNFYSNSHPYNCGIDLHARLLYVSATAGQGF